MPSDVQSSTVSGGDTLGSGAYGSLTDYYNRSVGPITSNDAFNDWASGILGKLQVGTWEELPSNYEQRLAQNSVTSGFPGMPESFTNAAIQFTNLNAQAEPTTPPPGNQSIPVRDGGGLPSLESDPLTQLSDIIASFTQPDPTVTITTIAPTSVTTNTATYNVNQNPSDILTPALEQQSGLFRSLLNSFDNLVSKVTDARTMPNVSNSALIAAGAESRPQYLMSPISSLSQPNQPGSTIATVRGEFGGSSIVQDHFWTFVGIALSIVGIIIWARKK
jgi:hypothetical protein